MSNISLRLPDSIHKQVAQLAKLDNTSINQFITLALAEKLSALHAVEYFQNRSKRGKKDKFKKSMSKVLSRPPLEEDKL